MDNLGTSTLLDSSLPCTLTLRCLSHLYPFSVIPTGCTFMASPEFNHLSSYSPHFGTAAPPPPRPLYLPPRGAPGSLSHPTSLWLPFHLRLQTKSLLQPVSLCRIWRLLTTPCGMSLLCPRLREQGAVRKRHAINKRNKKYTVSDDSAMKRNKAEKEDKGMLGHCHF